MLDFSLFGTSIDAGLSHSIFSIFFIISSLIRECLRCVETSTSRFRDISTNLTPSTFSSARVLVIIPAREFSMQRTLAPCGTLATALSFFENFQRRAYAETFDQRLLYAYNDQTLNFKDELKAEPSHIVFKSIVLLLKNCIPLFRVKFNDLLH